jgi:hypothetical protein
VEHASGQLPDSVLVSICCHHHRFVLFLCRGYFFSYQASRAPPAAIRSVLLHRVLVFWISCSRSRHPSSVRELGRLSRRRFFPQLVGRSRPMESGSVHPVFSLPFCICVFLPSLCLRLIILIVQEYHAWVSLDFRSGAKAFIALLADLSPVSLATISDSRQIHFPAAVFSVPSFRGC